MLRVASTNGLRPAADLGSLILSLEKAFDGLDNYEERIVTAEDIIICEETFWIQILEVERAPCLPLLPASGQSRGVRH